MPDLSLIENLCGIFKAKLEMSEPYSKNIEYLQATAEACRETLSNPFYTKSNLSLMPKATLP
jgi:hypothetical protein